MLVDQGRSQNPRMFVNSMLTPQFLRFVMVGVLNTCFGYSVFALLVWLGAPYQLATAISTLAGIAFNFQTTGRLVFSGAPWPRLIRFAAVYALIYLLNISGIALLLRLDVNVYVAYALLIPPLAVLTYLLHKKFVF